MIDAIAKKFSGDPVQAAPEHCPGCGNESWWLPKGQADWRCDACSPPPSEVFVAQRSGATQPGDGRATAAHQVRDPAPAADLEIVTVNMVTCCQPWCERCFGWQGKEVAWSDGSTETKCRTCGESMPEWSSGAACRWPRKTSQG